MIPLVVAAALAGGVRWATPDLDQDGAVGVVDLLLLVERWGPCLDPCCAADVNRDGVVGWDDLAELLRWWGVYDPKRYLWCRE